MNLTLISRRYPPHIGGAERMMGNLANAFANQGVAVTVLTSSLGVESLPTDEQTAAGPRITRLPTSTTRFLGTWRYMNNLRRWLMAHPPDLAYVSMLKHDAYVAVGVGQKLGFPVVLRPEGAGETGDIAWQARGRFGGRIAARCRQADAFIAISQAVHDELLQAGYDPARVQDLPNGVPVPEKPWNRRPNWNDAPRAIFVGRLAKEKCIDTLIQSWPSVRAVFPRATLSLVGDGPERSTLSDLAHRLGLAGAIEFKGAATEIEAQQRTADLFVLPSEQEGMSIALLEAMAIGIPVVASKIPGNCKLVTDFKHGRLAPTHDPHALAQVIIDQWQNLDRAIHMGRQARTRVQSHYSIDAVAQKHIDLFMQKIDACR